MAKQTFTVGQVLTAAQLTSLQQTAMGGGAASAKTASYTLVAADAGTTISMTSTSATTITVNTGLFAAGDTVFIQNLGSGNCTVTAGTATVSTAGSAILPTNDAGILYFVSTGVAIFYDFIQTGAVSPLTTKGDLYGFSTLDARIPIGANDTVLTADSNETLGLKWAAPAGGGGMTLLSTTSLTGNAVNVTSISTSYKALRIIVKDLTFNSDEAGPRLRFNNNSGATDYQTVNYIGQNGTVRGPNAYSEDAFRPLQVTPMAADVNALYVIDVPDYANTTTFKTFFCITAFNEYGYTTTGTKCVGHSTGSWFATPAAINEVNLFLTNSKTFSSGSIEIYGVN